MRKVNYSLEEIMKDMERSEKEDAAWFGDPNTYPEPPVVYIGDLNKYWEPIATNDGYVIYGASYVTGTDVTGRGFTECMGDFERLEHPSMAIAENQFPENSIIVKMNCSADSTHGTIYWAEKAVNWVVVGDAISTVAMTEEEYYSQVEDGLWSHNSTWKRKFETKEKAESYADHCYYQKNDHEYDTSNEEWEELYSTYGSEWEKHKKTIYN